MSDLAATIVGTLAAICSITSFAPQMIKIWKTRDASSVSLRMWLLTVAGFILWTSYGVMLGSWPVAVSNAVCLVASGVILGLKWKFREA